jgi:hypothetical protein
MKKTHTVRELISKLIQYDMDALVWIGLGSRGTPDDAAGILTTYNCSNGGIDSPVGVYLIPAEHLVDFDLLGEK